MVKIRITQPCTTAKLTLKPGDELHVSELTPGVKALLNARRIDNSPVAEIVRGNQRETATTKTQTTEKAVV